MIRIVTDSTASIPRSVADENNIDVVSLFINWKDVEYQDASMDVDSFYEDIYEMITDIPTSSQPSQAAFEDIFEEAAGKGDEVIGIFMSSRMSGTVDGALRAARSVAARHADFKYRIIDAMSNSYDEAYSVLAAASARSAGCTLDQCCALAQKAVAATRFLFTPESLRFLKAGGRIGRASALLGHIMKICPILTVTDGETTTFKKVRTHKKAVAAITNKFKEDIDEFGLKNVIVHYIGSSDEAVDWARNVIEPLCGRTVSVVPVSPVIGLHVGPAIGIVYECERPLPGKLSPGSTATVFAS
ncbi:MAG: DegV family protein [Eggerthellaceae bacterium]|nr:DegV family protein [Eggerthellaceae bacterium]